MAEKVSSTVEKNLLIVESPAKAKTIGRYLGKGFTVKASIGHIVDLPKKTLGVEIAKDFRPEYQVMPEKKKVAKEIQDAAKKADMIYLAPDPDREGEAIAWHIANLVSEAHKPVKRVLINEITKAAVQDAIAHAGEIDQNRFEAQQARRILDRLVGYQISPLLWRKIQTGLSAGRVQSVAVRLICEREREIQAFVVEEYWSIGGLFKAAAPPEFMAKFIEFKAEKIKIPDQASAEKFEKELLGLSYQVAKIEKKEKQKKPPEPFITARLQQEASKRFGFTGKKTMAVAQQLYEGVDLGDEGRIGLITYMRTDSVRVNAQAVEVARAKIAELFGPQYVPEKPNVYKSKKAAQDAHEAIRPTMIDHTPDKIKNFLTPEQNKLYRMIYERFLASQMKPALFDQTSIDLAASDYLFRATGTIIKFPGFLALWQEPEKEKAEGEENGDEAKKLPDLKVGDSLALLSLEKKQHFTQPPARYNEASLIRELEEKGIGRPSTYAQIVSTIQDRKYVVKEKNAFHPTELGFLVNDILIRSFPGLLDVKFTAQMEDRLDLVEEGKLKWDSLLKDFYVGFAKELQEAPKVIDQIKTELPTTIPCPKCGKMLMVRWSKAGEFLGCSAYPECDFTANFTKKENGEIVPVLNQDTGLKCPNCGKLLLVRKSRHGEFLGCTGYPKCKFTSDFEKTETGEIKLKSRAVTPDQISGLNCEKCGKPLLIKSRNKREFLACSGYPACRNIKNFKRNEQGQIEIIETKPDAGGVTQQACPKCGKPLAFKRGRFGPFLACTGYPECKFTQALKSKKPA
jgi:DNA topoisomerase I